MASRIASYITQKLIIESIIEEGDRELYCYGFFLLITRFLFLLVTVTTGFIADVWFESIVFYAVFMPLRCYAGGIHARTENVCTMLTTVALSVFVFGIKAMELTNSTLISWLMLSVGSLCIFMFSPLDTRSKPLEEQDKQQYQMLCYKFAFLMNLVAFISHILALNALLYPIACGVFLEGMLLCIGKCVYGKN